MVSIIVPIYNVEKYLFRCVDSILRQTYNQFELILVDDGSPDRCGEICDEYAQNDARIRVIHKENGGLSDARNAGMAIAQGAYICFVDSDDWVEQDYLKIMLNTLFKNGGDICECNVLRTNAENSETMSSLLEESDKSARIYTTKQAMQLLIEDKVLHQHVWNKLYRRECVEGILFPIGKTNEDEYWTYQVFSRANKVIKISDALYYYFQRPGSIMGSEYSLKRLDALDAKTQRQIFVEKYFPELKEVAEADLYASCIYSGQMTMMHLQGDEQQMAIEKIDQIRNSCRWKEIRRVFDWKGRVWGSLATMNFWGLCRLKNLLRRGI